MVSLPSESSNPARLKGFGYVEFEDLDSLSNALSLNEESLIMREFEWTSMIKHEIDRDDGSFS